MESKEIKEMVKGLICKYGTCNPEEIANCLGIFIQYGDLGSLPGCYLKKEEYEAIFINDKITDANFKERVIAHELAHAVMHNNNKYFSTSNKTLQKKAELEADIFVENLLTKD